MIIDNEHFENWMKRIMERFDQLLNLLESTRNVPVVDGEKLLDNQDICMMLNISKRTLQRYRSSGDLPFHMIYHKTYYKESDVQLFISKHFNKRGRK